MDYSIFVLNPDCSMVYFNSESETIRSDGWIYIFFFDKIELAIKIPWHTCVQ